MRGSSGATVDSLRTTRWAGSVRLRLAVMGSVIALLVLVIVAIKTATWNRVREVQQEFAEIDTKAFYLGAHLQGSVWKLNGRLLRFQLGEDSAEREAFQREARELTGWLAATAPQVVTPEERELAKKVQGAFRQYLADTSPLLEKGLHPVRKDSASLVHDQIVEKSASLLAICERLVDCQDTALARQFAASEKTLGALRHLMQLSTLLLLLCAGAITMLAYRVVIAPLRLKLDESQQAVARQEKLASLGTLAAGVAHEIRNPLTAIKFRLFTLKKELPEIYAEHEDLAVIHGEIERLERIVEDFLQFARPSEPQFIEIAAAEILQKVHELLKGSLEKQRINLKLETPESIKLRADTQQIQQVLINLVQNAADSIGRDGVITLRAHSGMTRLTNKPEPVVVFAVADSGSGIPQEAEQRLFDPFFSTKEGGTGLGLPIAARIAEKHGGAIHYESHRHRGSVFSLVLPRLTDEAGRAATTQELAGTPTLVTRQ